MTIYIGSMESPVGRIVLVSTDMHIKSLTFSDELDASARLPDIFHRAVGQLHEYFAGTRSYFELDLDPEGTGFQKKVWMELMLVPYGMTKSYRDIAIKTGSPLNTRAVGTANGKNPIPIIIPCHRIIASNGKLAGYSGGLGRKKWLLLHEAEHTKREMLF